MWPDLEFWFSGYALISFAGLLLALVLAALGVGPVLESRNHRRIVWLCVALVAALTWWQLSKQEAEKAKPDRDYAYFISNPDPRIVSRGAVGLTILATGVLRNIKWAVQTTADHDRLAINYIYSGQYPVVDEEGSWSGIFLPPGDYTFDIDPPSKLERYVSAFKLLKTKLADLLAILFTSNENSGISNC